MFEKLEFFMSETIPTKTDPQGVYFFLDSQKGHAATAIFVVYFNATIKDVEVVNMTSPSGLVCDNWLQIIETSGNYSGYYIVDKSDMSNRPSVLPTPNVGEEIQYNIMSIAPCDGEPSLLIHDVNRSKAYLWHPINEKGFQLGSNIFMNLFKKKA